MNPDPTKPLQTKSGYKVTLFGTNFRGDYPWKGIIHEKTTDVTHSWHDDGRAFCTSVSELDLINAPLKHVRKYWVNLYLQHFCDYLYPSKAAADKRVTQDRLACKEIEIEFTEGEGL